jgi:protein SCO1
MQISLALDQLDERDTPNALSQYVSSFNPHIIGLTGTLEQIQRVAASYKAYYAKYVPPDGGSYVIDHTGFTYLMGQDGKYLGFFPPGTSAERMLEMIKTHLSAG